MASRPVESRFWAFIAKTDGCWLWTGKARAFDGYGRFAVSHGRLVGAHRYSWELHNGPIPEGLSVCHHCDNPPCVRPEHLFLGTHADNAQDKVAKGRHYSLYRGVTRCIHGHEFTPDNTYWSPKEGERRRRQCRTCNLTSQRTAADEGK